MTYWKDHFDSPPEPDRTTPQLNTEQKEISSMTVAALLEVLIETYAGDSDRCMKVRRAQKDNFSAPDSLVSMYYDVRRESTTS